MHDGYINKPDPVQEFIINPMMALYQPPQHVRNNPEGLRQLMAAYPKALHRYTAETLQKAWDAVTTQAVSWTYPHPSVIADKCREFAKLSTRDKAFVHADKYESEPWKARRINAEKNARSYTKTFMQTSPTAKQAASEGWNSELQKYVQDMACAQELLRDGSSFCPGDLYLYAKSESEYLEAKADVCTARDTGSINVALPIWLMHTFQRIALARKEYEARNGNDRPRNVEAIVKDGIANMKPPKELKSVEETLADIDAGLLDPTNPAAQTGE